MEYCKTLLRIMCSVSTLVTLFTAHSITPKVTLPLGTQVNWAQLIKENQSPIAKQFINSSHTIYERLLYGGIPYPTQGITQRWENGYQSSYDKFVYMRKNGVDCTRLLRYLFLNMLHLPYNSKYKSAPIISHTFAGNNKHKDPQLKNFIPLPKTSKGFKPQTGDILAFPGHTIAVLDPKNCISIQSSIWMCKRIENDYCVDAEFGKAAGVSIYKLASSRFCKDGIWKGMDNEKLKFTVAWRHRAFNTWITEMPKIAKHKQVIILQGKNLAGKYIYFSGIKTPIKAKLVRKKVKIATMMAYNLLL